MARFPFSASCPRGPCQRVRWSCNQVVSCWSSPVDLTFRAPGCALGDAQSHARLLELLAQLHQLGSRRRRADANDDRRCTLRAARRLRRSRPRRRRRRGPWRRRRLVPRAGAAPASGRPAPGRGSPAARIRSTRRGLRSHPRQVAPWIDLVARAEDLEVQVRAGRASARADHGDADHRNDDLAGPRPAAARRGRSASPGRCRDRSRPAHRSRA